MTHHGDRQANLAEEVVTLLAGLADLALSGLSSAVGSANNLLRRADLGELLADGQDEAKARGRLFLDRHAGATPAHLEVLARTVGTHSRETTAS
ncbi:polyprenyl synthetase [Streptomyces sp. SDr-06]|uniref:polyprenyl synthetase n=1 Tax=Streptomyces sp. SDr-06 TaxID=2267702 RepID=UPI000DE9FE2A|nr:polyprenyl synthetase [Streptomyces sp. SDr-06]RCH64001.1 polyprenyl synthetase [Streptomyces sp. SDr-06]